MSLEHSDFERFERIMYKNSDDVAVSISRSFERLEERIDAAESRIYGRLAEIEDKIDGDRQDIAQEFTELKEAISQMARVRDLLMSPE